MLMGIAEQRSNKKNCWTSGSAVVFVTTLPAATARLILTSLNKQELITRILLQLKDLWFFKNQTSQVHRNQSAAVLFMQNRTPDRNSFHLRAFFSCCCNVSEDAELNKQTTLKHAKFLLVHSRAVIAVAIFHDITKSQQHVPCRDIVKQFFPVFY